MQNTKADSLCIAPSMSLSLPGHLSGIHQAIHILVSDTFFTAPFSALRHCEFHDVLKSVPFVVFVPFSVLFNYFVFFAVAIFADVEGGKGVRRVALEAFEVMPKPLVLARAFKGPQ